MANQNANMTITEQVRQHGELLARLTALFEQDHEDLGEVKEAMKLIAKAVSRQEARDEFWTRFMNIIVPLGAALVGGLIDHFLPR